MIVAEWIPFGKNHIMAFNEQLDSLRSQRIRGTLLTSYVDEAPEASTFSIKPILTEVTIAGFDPYRFLKFTAKLMYPEVVEQLEELGVYVESSGLIRYSADLFEVKGEERVPFDHLAMVLSDIVRDTSSMMDTMLSNFQRRVISIVTEKPLDRDKYTVVVTDELSPALASAVDYHDSEEKEGELNQIVEFVYSFNDLPNGDKLFGGTSGLVLVTRDVEAYEDALRLHLLVHSLELIKNSLFRHLWVHWDRIREAHDRLRKRGIGFAAEAQEMLSQFRSEVILVDNITAYMKQTIDGAEADWKALADSVGEGGRSLSGILNLEDSLTAAADRIEDIKNIAEALTNEIDGLSTLASTIVSNAVTSEARKLGYISLAIALIAFAVPFLFEQPLNLLAAVAAIALATTTIYRLQTRGLRKR